MVDMLQVSARTAFQPEQFHVLLKLTNHKEDLEVMCCLYDTGLFPGPIQGGARDPPALVLHNHLQRGEALHEEQVAGEGEWSKG